MEEIWKDAIGFEGLYQVSNFGRARSIAHEVNCNKGKRIVKGKLLKAVDRGNGYAFVTFGKDGKQYNISLHRMVASVFIPNPLNLPEVNHIDRNPMNARADNLEWCDRTITIITMGGLTGQTRKGGVLFACMAWMGN